MTFKYKSLNLYPPVEGDWLLIRARNIVINTIGQTYILQLLYNKYALFFQFLQ